MKKSSLQRFLLISLLDIRMDLEPTLFSKLLLTWPVDLSSGAFKRGSDGCGSQGLPLRCVL